MNFYVVIPARYASTRLPGKPLLEIAGKPMVVRVAEQAQQSGAQQIWIATDHGEIAGTVYAYGFKCCMTKVSHTSGTDRLAEVAQHLNWPGDAIVVNLQGDEPLMPPALIQAVARHLHEHPECAIATACHPLHEPASFSNPNIVKTVLDMNGNALYFSRAPIPWPRDTDLSSPALTLPPDLPVLRHIGIYAYRVSFLQAFTRLAPAAIEQYESLEQLRALYHGYKIGVVVVDQAPPRGVDTEEDLQAVRQFFASTIQPEEKIT